MEPKSEDERRMWETFLEYWKENKECGFLKDRDDISLFKREAMNAWNKSWHLSKGGARNEHQGSRRPCAGE